MTITPIKTVSDLEKAARRLAAQHLRLISDPEGLRLPAVLWQRMAGKLEDMAVAIAEEIVGQNKPDTIDNLGDGESLYFTGENCVINVVELSEKIWQKIIDDGGLKLSKQPPASGP